MDPWDEYSALKPAAKPASSPPPWEEYQQPPKAPWDEYASVASSKAPSSSSPSSEMDSFLNAPAQEPSGDLSQYITKDTPSGIDGQYGGAKSTQDLGIKDFAMTPMEGFGDIPDVSFPKFDPKTAGSINRAIDVAGLSKIIPKDIYDRASGIESGVLSDTVNFFKSPLGSLTSGIGGLPSLVQHGITAAFLASALKEAPEKYTAIRDAKTPEDRDEAIKDALDTALVIGGTGAHLLSYAKALPRPAGAPQEALDSAATRNQLRQLAPETQPIPEPQPKGFPSMLDGMMISRRKWAGTPEEFAALPPEVQKTHQAEIDKIDNELLKFDRNAVNESAARTAQPEPPTGRQELPAKTEAQEGPPSQGGTAAFFTQAKAEAAAPLEQAAENAKDVAPATAQAAAQAAETIKSSPPAEIAAAERTPADEPAGVKPAIQLPNGQVTTGEDHVGAYEEAKKTTPDTSGAKEGFVDESGKFINREEAADKTELPTGTEDGKLHSSDLPKEDLEFDPDAHKKLLDSLAEDEALPIGNEISPEQKRVNDIRQDIENNQDAPMKWRKQRAKDLKAAEEALAGPKSEVSAAEPESKEPEQPKEIWQKTREEVADEGGSLAKHRLAVREAVKSGQQVPLEVLEGYKASEWADKARESLYGQQISDTALYKIIKGLESDGSSLMADPLFIQSVGKPALRLALRGLKESIEGGKLAADAINDAVAILKKSMPTLDEGKAREFFKQAFKKKDEPNAHIPSVEPIPSEQPAPETIPEAKPKAEDAGPAEDSGPELTGIRNAIVDQERPARGIEQREPPTSRTFKAIDEAAKSAFEKNENVGSNLLADLSKQIRPLTDIEDAILTNEQVRRQNQYDRAVENVNNAVTDEEKAVAKDQLRQARDAVYEVYDLGQKAGTENGRGLNARKLLMAQDYTLANIENRARAANQGKPLEETPKGNEILEKLKDAHDRIKSLEDKLNENASKHAEESSKKYFDQLLKQTKKDMSAAAKSGRTFTDFITDQADAARKRIRERTKGAFALVDPTVLYDVAVIGAEKITKGLNEIGKWGKSMIEEFGDGIKPHLDQIFDKAKQFHAANEAAFPKTKPDEAVTENELKRKDVYDLVQKKIESGIDNFDDVMKAVHKELSVGNPAITEREVRDAFTEYGRAKFPSKDEVKMKLSEYRRIGQLVSAIEDAQKGEAPKKTGMQRSKPTIDVREKMKELKAAMDAAGIETQDPEQQLASTNQARSTALRNSIEDIDKQLKTGDKPKGKGPPRPMTPEVERLTSIRDAMKEKLKEIEDEANPPKSPEEKQLDTYKKNLNRQIEELKARQQGAPAKVRNTTQLDDEARSLQAKRNEERQKVDQMIYDIEQKNRPKYQKWLEQTAGAARFSALSGYHTLGKLLGFTLARAGIETPLTEAAGAVLSKTPGLRGVFAAAPAEAGNTLESLGRFYSGMATKGMREARRVLTKGSSELKSAYGKPEVARPKWYDFFGQVHSAEKTPLLVGTHEMYLNRLFRDAAKKGLDINNEFVRGAINKEAFDHAQRAILQEKNSFADAVSGLHARMEKVDPKTGQQNLTKALISTMVKTLLTKEIIKTPANYIAQTIKSTPLGLISGALEAAKANRSGIENLKPAEANAIARLLKTGAVGSAFFLLGAIDGTKKKEDRTFGGYWEPGRSRDDGDVPWGQLRIGGKVIPHLLTHNPLTESAQMGSTMMRVALSKLRKSDPESQGLATGAIQAIVGLASKAPIASPLMRAASERQPSLGTDILTGLIPQLVQNIAEDTDSVKDRAPQTTADKLKMAVPGLRQQVPVKQPKRRAKAGRYSAFSP